MKEDYNSIGAAETEDQKNEFQLSDMISWTLCHKKFFAISIVICVALGLIYAQRAQRIYQRSASVMLEATTRDRLKSASWRHSPTSASEAPASTSTTSCRHSSHRC